MGKREKAARFFQIDAKSAARLITFFGIVMAIFLTIFVWIIYQPGRHKHTALINESTKLRLSFHPAIIQDYVTSLAPGITRFVGAVPKFSSMQARAFRVDWIHALPYEITFLVEQRDNAALPLIVYVNPIPDNDSFVGEVNGWGALGRMPVIKWQSGRLTAAGEQQYTAKGEIPIGEAILPLLSAWPLGRSGLAPYSGGQFIEFAADNGGGILLALHSAFRDSLFAWTSAETEERLYALWPQIASVAVTGALTRDDEITFRLAISGTSQVNQQSAGDTIAAALDELGYYLSEREGLSLLNDGRWVGPGTYEATSQFTGFEAKIRQIWRN